MPAVVSLLFPRMTDSARPLSAVVLHSTFKNSCSAAFERLERTALLVLCHFHSFRHQKDGGGGAHSNMLLGSDVM
jgi:hypothetical protein